MTFFDGLILGLVQGLTEFLPVSSTGHLILAREFFHIGETDGLAVDAVLQLGTVLAVLLYFRSDLWKIFQTFLQFLFRKEVDSKEKTLLFSIFFGTIPAVIFGLLLEKKMEVAFRDDFLVAIMLIFGSILFVIAEAWGKQMSTLTIKKGIGIGFFQCLALLPGVSRSGATISGGLLLGLSREEAARFSFLLSFPIIAGSGLLKLKSLFSLGLLSSIGAPLFLGFITSFLVGLLTIGFLLRFLKTHSLIPFAIYRTALAFGILLFAL
ncbi:MAG: undecaprenyl-diphosphatase UppP [Patescibacteria group bacterium]